MARNVVINIIGDASKLRTELGSADRSLGSFESGVSRMGGALAGFAAKAAAAAAVAGGAIAAWGVKSAGDMQQVEIAFEGIMGSAQKSAVFLDDLRAFAAKTPFEFPELARSAKMLMATGTAAEDVIPVMTRLGNVAATLGVGGAEIEGVVRALGQMKGKGKASAEELQQISEQIPGFSAINAIAQKLGVTTSEAFDLMSDGAIDADTAIQAILEGMERFPGAAGAMERQSKTLLGVLSTLKDTARDALVDGIGPMLPAMSAAIESAVPSIKTALGAIGQTFGDLVTAIAPLIEKLLPVVGTLVDALGDFLVDAIKMLVPVIEGLLPNFEAFLAAVKPLATALLESLLPVITTLAPVILDLGTKIAVALVPVVEALAGPLATLAELFAAILEVIGPWPVIIVGAGVALAGLAATMTGVVGPAIAAFSAGFIGATVVLEAVFGKARDLGAELNALTTAASRLTELSDAQLVPAFQDLQTKFADTHENATGMTVVLGAFDEVANQNLGTAARLAEQYKSNTSIYDAMQHMLVVAAEKQRQQNADTAAGSEIIRAHAAEVEALDRWLAELPAETSPHVSVSVDRSAFDELMYAMDVAAANPRTVGLSVIGA